MKEEFTYKSKEDLTKIHAVVWKPASEIKAIVQIAHGMTEHINRYEEFAKALNNQGILVCGNDHLGHGKSVIDENHLGYFAKKNGRDVLVDDVVTLTNIMQVRYPNTPYYILGHSMGSFIVRNYITSYSNRLAGCILIGSAQHSKLKMNLGKQLAKTTQFYHHGWFYRSPLLYKMTTGNYYKKFEEGMQNHLCWLTTNNEIIETYKNDPLSNFKFTCNGYYTLFDLIKGACSKKRAKKINKDLPMFIMTGKDDPVGRLGKDIYKIEKLYKKVGIKDVRIKVYNGMRHEVLNEVQNVVPITDIVNFINKI